MVFDLPDDYQELTSSVSLEVIAPGDQVFGCDEVELGDVDAATVGALVVEDALLTAGEGEAELDRVPREGRKLFVARATTSSASWSRPAAPSGIWSPATSRSPSRGCRGLPQRARDLPARRRARHAHHGRLGCARAPALRVTARYRTVAANSETQVREVDTDGEGTLELVLDQPAWDGPQAVDIDVAWQGNQLEPVTGFRTPPLRFGIDLLPGQTADPLSPLETIQIGRVGPEGEMGVAVLSAPTPAAFAGSASITWRRRELIAGPRASRSRAERSASWPAIRATGS